MEDCIDSLEGAQMPTALDALWQYWKVPIKGEDKENSIFSSFLSAYHCARIPFGIRNVPGTFQLASDIILSGVLCKMCFVYKYIVVILSRNNRQQIKEIDEAQTMLCQAGVTLKLPKFHIS